MNNLRDLLLQAVVQLDNELEQFKNSDYWYKECTQAQKKNQELDDELKKFKDSDYWHKQWLEEQRKNQELGEKVEQLQASYKAEAARKEGEVYAIAEYERGVTTQK